MAITHLGLDSSTGTASTTLAIVNGTVAVGDMRRLRSKINGTPTITSISGGNCTTWTKVAGPDTDTNGTAAKHEMWIGTVTNTNSTGKETITITWSATVTGLGIDFICRSFSNGNATTTWARDGAALTFKNNASTTTITYPTGTATNAGELYTGGARCPSGGSYGTPGGTPASGWVTGTDANGNPDIYNLSVGSGSIAPTQSTTATLSYANGVLIIATIPAVTVWDPSVLSQRMSMM
jgi:hypothetical protein